MRLGLTCMNSYAAAIYTWAEIGSDLDDLLTGRFGVLYFNFYFKINIYIIYKYFAAYNILARKWKVFSIFNYPKNKFKSSRII